MMKTAYFLVIQCLFCSAFAQNSLLIKVKETTYGKEKHVFSPERTFTVVQKNPQQKVNIDTFQGIPITLVVNNLRIDENGAQYYAYRIVLEEDTLSNYEYIPYCPSNTTINTRETRRSDNEYMGYVIEYNTTCDSSTVKKSNISSSSKQTDYHLKINNTKLVYEGKVLKEKWPTVFSSVTGMWTDTVYSKVRKSRTKSAYQIGLSFKVEKYFVNGIEGYDLHVECIKKDKNGTKTINGFEIQNIGPDNSKKNISAESNDCKLEISNITFEAKKP